MYSTEFVHVCTNTDFDEQKIVYSSIMMRAFKIIFTGFCMGAADIVPGVSGGTMAFILGIYQELLDTIRRFASKEIWAPLLQGDFASVVRKSNWKFLVLLATGILLAIATLSQLLEQALQQYPVYIWCFFFGLVVASAMLVSRRITKVNFLVLFFLLFGMVLAYAIVGLVPTETSNAPWFLILSGAIAICAMILPGISGSFLLVILGKYEFVLRAVNTRDFVSLSYIALGAGGGLLAFSHVLSWLMHKYYNYTVALLTGLMIGSLRKIWPWKDGDLNVLPELSNDWVLQLGIMIVGCMTVLFLEKIAELHD